MIAKGGTLAEEGQPELANAKRYGVQQVIILVPFLVVVLALIQESHRERYNGEALIPNSRPSKCAASEM